MSREAAERIVEAANYLAVAENYKDAANELNDLLKDHGADLARAYLALLAPTEDDEKTAREIVEKNFPTWFDNDEAEDYPELSRHIIDQFKTALAAARARQREADAKIATDDADRNIEASGRANMCGDVPSVLHRELEASTGYRIAAAIRGAP